MKIYLAGPLFSAAERKYNVALCQMLEDTGYEVFLPQRDAPQYDPSKPNDHAPAAIFSADLTGLCESDCVVAIVDGSDVDSGTAWECGAAYMASIPIIALRTDFRMFATNERFNLMIEQSADKVVTTLFQLMEALSTAEKAEASK